MLKKTVESSAIPARNESFPQGPLATGHESVYFTNPRGLEFSYLEVSKDLLVFYAHEIGHVEDNRENPEVTPTPDEIYTYSTWILAWLMLYIKFSLKAYTEIGYSGSLQINLSLENVAGRNIRTPWGSDPKGYRQTVNPLDQAMTFQYAIDTIAFNEKEEEFFWEVYKEILFSCGLYNAYELTVDDRNWLLGKAYGFLMWQRPGG